MSLRVIQSQPLPSASGLLGDGADVRPRRVRVLGGRAPIQRLRKARRDAALDLGDLPLRFENGPAALHFVAETRKKGRLAYVPVDPKASEVGELGPTAEAQADALLEHAADYLEHHCHVPGALAALFGHSREAFEVVEAIEPTEAERALELDAHGQRLIRRGRAQLSPIVRATAKPSMLLGRGLR
ncbi:hypothetical protein LA345_13390 [Burkholderia vietnamiensis]|uniref:Uncharacterized protein n=1 Tax=Burkholderia vietnamiensis (strain G4 / LMG 22486) TaxID=269482 RepID=A4JFU9_BURVG|nr:hypothetical protein Bcep1808_2150 [Burkholderia vietnamiensis G4]MCB4344908.1 hypothetical protein [Burkholderia vietnamiensis]